MEKDKSSIPDEIEYDPKFNLGAVLKGPGGTVKIVEDITVSWYDGDVFYRLSVEGQARGRTKKAKFIDDQHKKTESA